MPDCCEEWKQKARDLMIEKHKIEMGWALATGCTSWGEYEARQVAKLMWGDAPSDKPIRGILDHGK